MLQHVTKCDKSVTFRDKSVTLADSADWGGDCKVLHARHMEYLKTTVNGGFASEMQQRCGQDYS